MKWNHLNILVQPDFHDGELNGFLALDNGEYVLFLKTYKKEKIQIKLSGVTHFKTQAFIGPDIVFEIKKCQVGDLNDQEFDRVFGVLNSTQKGKVLESNRNVLEVISSMTCNINIVYKDISVEEGWYSGT
jgi:hypothetical protein